MTEPDALATDLVARLIASKKTVATAESCTGGWIGKSITDVPGSSMVYGYGLVTYSNEAKTRLVGVGDALLGEHGAVSEPVVRQMAAGVRELSAADLAVAVSGVAGPGGGSDEKPVGTVWIAWASAEGVDTLLCQFDGDRDAVRRQTVEAALNGLLAHSD